MSIAAVLLAAGGSVRMGRQKQLLLFNGVPLIRHVALTALESGCREVIVVLGSGADEIRPALDGLSVHIVVNADWSQGMGTSIHAGVLAAQELEVDGLILTLADMPLISAKILNRLIATHSATSLPIVASQYGGSAGVPAYFARSIFPELLALPPSQGCKGIILGHADKAVRLACPEAEMDIDTPEDYVKSAYPA